MRVGSGDLTGIHAAKSGKPLESPEVERGAGIGEDRRGAGGDRVELSDLTGRLARALHAEETMRTARVEELAREYRSGVYRADPVAVSRGLIEEAAAELAASAGVEG